MFSCYRLETYYFLMRKGVGPEGRGGREELEGLEVMETVIKIYYMTTESIFN